MTYLFDIRNATVYRKDNLVFENLNLCIRLKQPTAILGPNGAGKTTLLKLLSRELYPVVKPDSYIKLFDNERINLWELREKIGLVSHDFQVAYETLANGLDVVLSAFFGSRELYEHHQTTAEQIQSAKLILSKLALDELQDSSFLKLSTGQQRRLLLARAMVHDPEALILDEPTAGLDLAAAAQLIGDMRTWCQSGKSLVLVTHHAQEIIPEIERIIFIKQGKIIQDGAKSELLNSDALSDLYDCKLKVKVLDGFYSIFPD